MEHAKTADRHVVVVDDEPLFLKFAGIPFRSGFCGFCTWHLHAFTDTAEALGFFELYSEKVDVILTDFHMPAMNGLEFIEAVRSRSSSRDGVVPAIIVSSDPPAEGLLPERVSSVLKPFTKDDIARALCDVSVVCATGRCASCHDVEKPQPAASMLRDRLDDEVVAVFR